MRHVAPMLFAPYALLAASLFAALRTRLGKPGTPSTPARAPDHGLAQRVRVALQAAARARR